MTKYGFLCMIDRSGYSNNINFISFVMFWIRSTPCLKGGMTFAYNLQILFISVYFGLFRHKHDGNPKGKNFFYIKLSMQNINQQKCCVRKMEVQIAVIICNIFIDKYGLPKLYRIDLNFPTKRNILLCFVSNIINSF